MNDKYKFEINFCKGILKRDPEYLPVMELLAGYLTKSGNIDDGLAIDRKIVELDPDNAISHYNLACSLALKHMQGEAIDSLRTALEQGYDDFSWLMKDTDLQNLHDNPAFSALLSEFQAG
jgi:tetratricopeptide (TPR) repeat protein